MKIHLILLLILFFRLSSNAQDTCIYVSGQNQIGGLDCGVTTLAMYTADSYQWLDCDNSYNLITNQTLPYYTGENSKNVALEISYLGCVDTSNCYHICSIGIEELKNKNRKLIKVVNYLGVESEIKPNTLLIYIYNDGTKEKVFRIE